MRLSLNQQAFEIFPVIQTRRLKMRPILLEDAPAIFDMQQDDLVSKYIYNKKPETLQDVEKQIHEIEAAYHRQEMLCWAATIRKGNTIIVTCGLHKI